MISGALLERPFPQTIRATGPYVEEICAKDGRAMQDPKDKRLMDFPAIMRIFMPQEVLTLAILDVAWLVLLALTIPMLQFFLQWAPTILPRFFMKGTTL